MARFGFDNFLTRWAFALFLVLVSFNPTRFSYFNWVMTEGTAGPLPFKILVGALLATGFIIYLHATFRSVGAGGLMLLVLIFGSAIWSLIAFGLLKLDSASAVTWVLEIVLATIMAIGISWSHVQRRLTGQIDVESVEEDR